MMRWVRMRTESKPSTKKRDSIKLSKPNLNHNIFIN